MGKKRRPLKTSIKPKTRVEGPRGKRPLKTSFKKSRRPANNAESAFARRAREQGLTTQDLDYGDD